LRARPRNNYTEKKEQQCLIAELHLLSEGTFDCLTECCKRYVAPNFRENFLKELATEFEKNHQAFTPKRKEINSKKDEAHKEINSKKDEAHQERRISDFISLLFLELELELELAYQKQQVRQISPSLTSPKKTCPKTLLDALS
jgi:hypothetical protein